MELLPEIFPHVHIRPGNHHKKKHHIPNPEYGEFWEALTLLIRKKIDIQDPVDPVTIDPFFGYFGERFHPVSQTPHYFHLGIDIASRVKNPIHPIADGILEYSGFDLINGNYVVISHPELKTEDGFIFQTLYMHMKEAFIRFTSYQKMLREISLHTYPKIPIQKTTILGTVGTSGNADKRYSHIHLQCEFKHPDGRVIVINPAPLLGIVHQENKTASINSESEFITYLEKNKNQLHEYGVDVFWK